MPGAPSFLSSLGSLQSQLGQQISISCLVCHVLLPVGLLLLLLVALSGLLFAQLAIIWFVEGPLHVVDAPVECFLAHLFLLGFVVLGRSFLPFFVSFLESLI